MPIMDRNIIDNVLILLYYCSISIRTTALKQSSIQLDFYRFQGEVNCADNDQVLGSQ